MQNINFFGFQKQIQIQIYAFNATSCDHTTKTKFRSQWAEKKEENVSLYPLFILYYILIIWLFDKDGFSLNACRLLTPTPLRIFNAWKKWEKAFTFWTLKRGLMEIETHPNKKTLHYLPFTISIVLHFPHPFQPSTFILHIKHAFSQFLELNAKSGGSYPPQTNMLPLDVISPTGLGVYQTPYRERRRQKTVVKIHIIYDILQN